MAKLLPVLRGVQVVERNADILFVIDHPLQGDLAALTRQKVGDDRAMARYHHIQGDIGASFNVNDLVVNFGFMPAGWGLVFS